MLQYSIALSGAKIGSLAIRTLCASTLELDEHPPPAFPRGLYGSVWNTSCIGIRIVIKRHYGDQLQVGRQVELGRRLEDASESEFMATQWPSCWQQCQLGILKMCSPRMSQDCTVYSSVCTTHCVYCALSLSAVQCAVPGSKWVCDNRGDWYAKSYSSCFQKSRLRQVSQSPALAPYPRSW